MRRRNVKYGFFISALAIIAFLSKKRSKSALKQYSKRIEELTLIEEKNQASKDLHNNIGHTFTSVITSLDALPFLMKKSPEEAEKNIKVIAELARKGLDEVRKTIQS